MNQNRPGLRIFATSGLLVVLAVVALVVASALTGRDGGRVSVVAPFPAAHAQFQPGAGPGRMWQGHVGMRRGGFGAGGTITQINGSTLTLRTEEGTETVNTSNATQYTKERQTISFGDLKVGDVVRVIPDAGSARPATPGTGTVSASRIIVVEPTLGGRVTSVDGNTVNLVGRGGRELTVTLTDSTKYFNGQATADRSAITVGSHLVASGSQDSLTHLTADVVTVLPASARGAAGAGPFWRGFPGGFPGGPGLPGPAGGGFFKPGGFGA